MKGRNNKRNKKKKKSSPHKREVIFTQGLQHLCGGYYKVGNIYYFTIVNEIYNQEKEYCTEICAC